MTDRIVVQTMQVFVLTSNHAARDHTLHDQAAGPEDKFVPAQGPLPLEAVFTSPSGPFRSYRLPQDSYLGGEWVCTSNRRGPLTTSSLAVSATPGKVQKAWSLTPHNDTATTPSAPETGVAVYDETAEVTEKTCRVQLQRGLALEALQAFLDDFGGEEALAHRNLVIRYEREHWSAGNTQQSDHTRLALLPGHNFTPDLEQVLAVLQDKAGIMPTHFITWPHRQKQTVFAGARPEQEALLNSFILHYFWLMGGNDHRADTLYGNFFNANAQKWSDADLRGVQLNSKTVNNLTMRRARLDGADFSTTTLENLDAQRARGLRVNFYLAQLPSAQLQNTVWTEANFNECVLEDANLSGACFTRCHMANAVLDGACLDKTAFVDMEIGDWILAADVLGARFDSCTMSSGLKEKLLERGAVVD